MLHKFLVIMHAQFSKKEVLFLLIAYELAKGDWIRRQSICDVMNMSRESSTACVLTNNLLKRGMIETQKEENNCNQGFCQLRLTKEARDILVGAFKASRA